MWGQRSPCRGTTAAKQKGFDAHVWMAAGGTLPNLGVLPGPPDPSRSTEDLPLN